MTDFVEVACRAHYDAALSPGQLPWDQLAAQGDERLVLWRKLMRTALITVLQAVLEEIDPDLYGSEADVE